ncbi:MAG: hypothetical protein IT429_18655 [Gemmataceae bacterium]|nr:hypothetical protein [Gemmataceae bacterium]
MKLLELQQILRHADPAAVLVSQRVLERVIQEVLKLPTLLWRVPHRQSCVVDRQILFRHVEQEELELESDQLLPPTVLLLVRPSFEELTVGDAGGLLLRYWQRLFHAKIHASLGERYSDGRLTLADIRARIEQIGQVEFEEIRAVLTQDQYLLPEADERAVYVEFVAVYYDLRHFAPDLLPIYFPGIRDFERVEGILGQDVDADALFQQTRLAGTPDPSGLGTTDRPDESQEYYWKLVHASERAARTGNLVRATILRMRAARVAPGSLSFGTRAEAVQYLQRLATRLQSALQLTDAEAGEWMKDLPALLDKADQGAYPVEAALLFDLQKTCLDYERDLYALDLVEWALSAGRKPIKRPLPSQRSVLVIKHLRAAAQRLTMARLSDADRQHFGSLLLSALQGCEERLRAKFRPVLATALHDVGLQPENAPERTAFNKLIEEILDRITAFGYLTYSDLRDAISRNQLKLPDLSDPQEFIRGDPLLRLDRRLATLLDGVYRPSEIYMRMLERTTALSFGTQTGRLLMRYVLLPFGGAWMLLEMAIAVIGLFVDGPLAITLDPATPPTAVAGLVGEAAGGVWGMLPAPAQLARVEHWSPPRYIYYPVLALLGVFLFTLLHHAVFRRKCRRAVRKASRAARVALIEWPIRLVQIPALRRIVTSWLFQLFYWYVFKPLVVCILLWFFYPEPFNTLIGKLGVFALAYLLLNSRVGHAASEAANQILYRAFELLRAGLIPGLVHLVTRVFKQITDAVESFLFAIDEWLWFRSGEGRVSLVVRTVLGLVWFPIAYLLRFIMVVLIEPGYNPLKAPVSYLAAKFMAPLTLFLLAWLPGAIGNWPTPLRAFALVFGWLIIFHLPDVFGFLFWEMKESWSLYRANRPRALRSVVLGSHGETVRRLLRPGFHSGTVPKLYTKLRKAERWARVTGNWRRSRACRLALEEVEEAFRQFITRELVFLLNQSISWQGQGLAVGRVVLSSNRIGAELTHGGHPERAVWLGFEECAGWLVAHVRDAGWLGQLTEEQAAALNTALATVYKLAGVDLVREQVQTNLPPAVASYDITRTGLALWVDRRHGTAIYYDLVDQPGRVLPRTAGWEPAPAWPPLDVKRLMFAALPLSWDHLVASWQKDREREGHPRLVCQGVEVDLIGPALPAVAVVPRAAAASTGGTAAG